MQPLMDAVNFTDGNSYRQGALNNSEDALPCLLLFPLTLLNLTSSPSALTNYAILCKFPIFSRPAKKSHHTVSWTESGPIPFEWLCPMCIFETMFQPTQCPLLTLLKLVLHLSASFRYQARNPTLEYLQMFLYGNLIKNFTGCGFNSRCKPDSIQTLI